MNANASWIDKFPDDIFDMGPICADVTDSSVGCVQVDGAQVVENLDDKIAENAMFGVVVPHIEL